MIIQDNLCVISCHTKHVHALQHIILSCGGKIENQVRDGNWVGIYFSPRSIYKQVQENWQKWLDTFIAINN